jgi:hypothetical protein
MGSKFLRFGATPIRDLTDLATRLAVLGADLSMVSEGRRPLVLLEGVPIGLLEAEEPGDDPVFLTLAGRKVPRIAVIASSVEWDGGFCVSTDEGDAFHVVLP